MNTGKTAYKDRGRDWSFAATGQETLGLPEAGRGKKRSCFTNALILDLHLPELYLTINFSCFKPPSLEYFVPAALETT